MPTGRFAKDITNEKYGRLTIIRQSKTVDKRAMWLCECECGNTATVSGKNLRSGGVKSCGCLRSDSPALCDKHKSNLVGSTFGRLFVIAKGKRDASGYRWICKCSCGNECEHQRSALTSGAVKSCGCFQKEKTKQVGHDNKTHGATSGGEKDRTYSVWSSMRSRCRDMLNHKYGGRGITVCERWEKYENFLADMGLRPEALSIDRIDTNGNYEPENCRWATATEQANNRRGNRRFEYKGESKTLAELSRISGIKSLTLSSRLQRGWSLEQSITTPLGSKKP